MTKTRHQCAHAARVRAVPDPHMERYLGGYVPPAKRQCVREEEVDALIYEWILDRVDPEHTLFNTSYFGQVVRTGYTWQEMLHKRTQDHISAARREPKELGLHWAIRVFGADAFTVRMVETTRLPRVEAMKWANEREMALIDENGGIMRDCDPSAPMHQTFNLTSGGQGNNPHKVWEGIRAISRKKLMNVWPKLEAYYQKHQHLRAPHRDPDVGNIVHHIRVIKCFLWHADFKAWLDDRHFVYEDPSMRAALCTSR